MSNGAAKMVVKPGFHALRHNAKMWMPGRHGGKLDLRRHQILHPHPVAVLDDLRDPLPVAVGVVALVAEQADRAGFFHQR